MHRFTQDTTLMGTVESVNDGEFQLRCRSGDIFRVRIGRETSCAPVSNLDHLSRNRVPEPSGFDAHDPAQVARRYIAPGRLVVVEGVYHDNDGNAHVDARAIHLASSFPDRYVFEETHWWLTQIARFADKWLDDLFGERRSYRVDDFAELYNTNLNILGLPMDDNVQEMATLSRLIYGLSSAYLLTGSERYLLAAAAGVEFQRVTFRSMSHDGVYNFWAYGKRRGRYGTHLLVPSENPDDVDTLPLYEQIYALAGLAQYFRITGDWEVLEDIRRTIRTFDDFYLDEKSVNEDFPGLGGYFSHLDYATMRPDVAALGDNQSRKNWNSIGDHIPAYLVNVILALDPLPQGEYQATASSLLDRCRRMLDRCADLIVEKFPDPNPEIPYVRERFDEKWSPDLTWRWQQNRAVVGHNFKISWNLIRVANYYRMSGQEPKAQALVDLAARLADDVTPHGIDQFRGGCFDTVERQPAGGELEFPWRNTKDFWQQEQALLAYLILYGETRDEKYLELAREQALFWNLYFLDRDNGGIFFRVNDNGMPVIAGQYANKGGHAIAGYHSFELNYLAHVYTRIHVAELADSDRTFCLYFQPRAGLRSINVLPDFVRPGEVAVQSVRINGRTRTDLQVRDFQLPLDDVEPGATISVRFQSASSAQGL